MFDGSNKKLLSLCRRFIRRCKQGCLQFVILKPILVTVTFVLYAKGRYEDGNFSANQAYLYITIIYTFSYSLALYALALFYVACRDLLKPFNPVPKFIIIKSVVFLTYWQVRFCFFCASLYVFILFLSHPTNTHTQRPTQTYYLLSQASRELLSFLCYHLKDLENDKLLNFHPFQCFPFVICMNHMSCADARRAEQEKESLCVYLEATTRNSYFLWPLDDFQSPIQVTNHCRSSLDEQFLWL